MSYFEIHFLVLYKKIFDLSPFDCALSITHQYVQGHGARLHENNGVCKLLMVLIKVSGSMNV
jgi:hypothetical protein